MINPTEIVKKARRKYPAFLASTTTSEPFFPLVLPVGKLPKDYATLNQAVPELIARSKMALGYGYTLDLRRRNTRKYSEQSLPERIYIESQKDYLKLLKKEEEFSQFEQDVALIRSQLPELSQWMCDRPMSVVQNSEQWPSLLKVCQYFLQHPNPDLYIRELPIQVHTKFIEQNKQTVRSLLEAILPDHQLVSTDPKDDYTFEKRFSLKYPESLIRLRILDPALRKKYGFPANDMSFPVSDFSQLSLTSVRCFITENLLTFLTLPYLKNGVAIFGSGYAVNRLKAADWLSSCSIFYWGDIDADGFKILSQLRTHFRHTQSVLMDSKTFEHFQEFSVSPEAQHTEVKHHETPDYLTEEEQSLYAQIVLHHQRLEQERIDQVYVNQHLQRLSCQINNFNS